MVIITRISNEVVEIIDSYIESKCCDLSHPIETIIN